MVRPACSRIVRSALVTRLPGGRYILPAALHPVLLVIVQGGIGVLRDGVEVTAEITGFLADLRTFRFIEAPRFPLEKPRPPKLTPAERMAQLRRFTGQDRRGRK